MDKLLIYSKKIGADPLKQCSRDKEIRRYETMSAFARTLVDETDILAGIFELSPGDNTLRNFILSIAKHFPLLSIGVIREEGPDSFYQLLGEALEKEKDRSLQWFFDKEHKDKLVKSLCRYINSAFSKNRRAHHRFEWILNGYLDGSSGTVKKYKIRSFGAGGAFLETEGDYPTPGTQGQIRVEFQNFQMITDCEFLDPRNASSNLPFGFGVRFLNLSPESERKIDAIVKDALFQILVQPETEPEVPSLGEEELTPDFYMFL